MISSAEESLQISLSRIVLLDLRFADGQNRFGLVNIPALRDFEYNSDNQRKKEVLHFDR